MIDYKQSGVDINAGSLAVSNIKNIVKQTFDHNVLTDIGTFGAMYDIGKLLKNYNNPVLVQSTDSVGTKVMIANMMERFDTIGLDIIGHSCGDIISQGARPLTFLDYIAVSKVVPDQIEEIVQGIANGCKDVGMSLIGGEVAELPGVYQEGEYDLVGSISGVVEKDNIIDGKNIIKGDIVLGFASNGLHTNGYSLARKLFFEIGGYKIDSKIPELDNTVGETLLAPHANYTNPILSLINDGIEIKGIAHITGGGFIENIPRILPDELAVEIKKSSWPILPVFNIMQRLGNIEELEMYRTFNMGIGIILIVSPEEKSNINDKLKTFPNYKLHEIGKVVEGNNRVILI